MKEAIKQAKKAMKINEVPIGCVIVYNDEIIGRGYNRRMTDKNTLSHAELNAIKKAIIAESDVFFVLYRHYQKFNGLYYNDT